MSEVRTDDQARMQQEIAAVAAANKKSSTPRKVRRIPKEFTTKDSDEEDEIAEAKRASEIYVTVNKELSKLQAEMREA